MLSRTESGTATERPSAGSPSDEDERDQSSNGGRDDVHSEDEEGQCTSEELQELYTNVTQALSRQNTFIHDDVQPDTVSDRIGHVIDLNTDSESELPGYERREAGPTRFQTDRPGRGRTTGGGGSTPGSASVSHFNFQRTPGSATPFYTRTRNSSPSFFVSMAGPTSTKPSSFFEVDMGERAEVASHGGGVEGPRGEGGNGGMFGERRERERGRSRTRVSLSLEEGIVTVEQDPSANSKHGSNSRPRVAVSLPPPAFEISTHAQSSTRPPSLLLHRALSSQNAIVVAVEGEEGFVRHKPSQGFTASLFRALPGTMARTRKSSSPSPLPPSSRGRSRSRSRSPSPSTFSDNPQLEPARASSPEAYLISLPITIPSDPSPSYPHKHPNPSDHLSITQKSSSSPSFSSSPNVTIANTQHQHLALVPSHLRPASSWISQHFEIDLEGEEGKKETDQKKEPEHGVRGQEDALNAGMEQERIRQSTIPFPRQESSTAGSTWGMGMGISSMGGHGTFPSESEGAFPLPRATAPPGAGAGQAPQPYPTYFVSEASEDAERLRREGGSGGVIWKMVEPGSWLEGVTSSSGTGTGFNTRDAGGSTVVSGGVVGSGSQTAGANVGAGGIDTERGTSAGDVPEHRDPATEDRRSMMGQLTHHNQKDPPPGQDGAGEERAVPPPAHHVPIQATLSTAPSPAHSGTPFINSEGKNGFRPIDPEKEGMRRENEKDAWVEQMLNHTGLPQPPPIPAFPIQPHLGSRSLQGHGNGNGNDRTISARLLPTVQSAKELSSVTIRRAKLSSILLNAALGLQLLVGSLIIGFAASPSTSASASSSASAASMCHRWEIATIVLGGISILLTGVMIRLRGDGEPERSRARVRELEKFIRTCEATLFDHGHENPDSPSNVKSYMNRSVPSKKYTELLRTVDAYRAEYDALLHSWGR